MAYVNTTCKSINQSESLSWTFSDLSWGKWYLQRKYMCRQHETLTAENCTNSYQTHVTEVVKDMCDNRMFYKIDIWGINIWGWVKIFLTL